MAYFFLFRHSSEKKLPENSSEDELSVYDNKYKKMFGQIDKDIILRAQPEAEKRRILFELEERKLLKEAEELAKKLLEEQEKEDQEKVLSLLQDDQTTFEEMKKKRDQLEEHHKRHAKVLDARMKEGHQRQMEAEAARKRQLGEANERLLVMAKLQVDLKMHQDEVSKALAKCRFPNLLEENIQNCRELMVQVGNKVDTLIEVAKKSENSISQLQVITELCGKAKTVLAVVNLQVDRANERGDGEVAKKKKKEEEEKKKKEEEEAAKKKASPAQLKPEEARALGVSPEALAQYLQLQKEMEAVEQSFVDLVKNPQLKNVRFDLQKGVNVPVNAVSGVSGPHLRDKLNKICTLLSGHPVDIGSKRITAQDHAGGVAYCKQLFAKKIVKQGDEQVSSKSEAAFPFAAVAAGVWAQYPDVGNMLLAFFHRKCPYTVPYYPSKKDQQTSEEYWTSLGYRYVDGELEKQDKFLKRMTGLIRLFAAIFVSPTPKGQAHPHGMNHAWQWLTRVINISPRPDITATMLLEFLQVTGHSFLKCYGKQFAKLVQFIITDYLPEIRKVTQGAGGPVSRLEIFLEGIIKNGRVDPPEGLISHGF
ncbi:hypothetical protein CAPTEDRAFT_225594 [Capitella teleta]|uniref:mRNA export factor GLE1 n=1 Tax=Capitella teleta TaxID=283909 RepID=R7UCF4_CAPTE|nr:hypothetical protein CAPTEDRAFT_225594 [Capitella teleta]|eukprot:ELU04060.1 hypothetical protein CAPTEDRAFT_225594 [Capitella teleta]